jgi:hypothetical protein
MAEKGDKRKAAKPSSDAEYVRGGKGRKDQIEKSGIYPASAPDAPGDAVIRTEGELVGHSSRPATPQTNRTVGNEDDDELE